MMTAFRGLEARVCSSKLSHSPPFNQWDGLFLVRGELEPERQSIPVEFLLPQTALSPI